MTRMFQRIRPRQRGSYFYLSDHADQSRRHVGQMKTDTIQEAKSHNEMMMIMLEEKPATPEELISTSLEMALAVQTTYTNWTNKIWEPNFDDADGEIVFEFCDGILEEDGKEEEDGYWNNSTSVHWKKSMETETTQDETNPSSCSSPASNLLLTTPTKSPFLRPSPPSIECDALELCDRIDNDFSPIKSVVVAPNNNNNNNNNDDDDGGDESSCALLACSADLRSQFLTGSNNKSPRYKQDTANNTSLEDTSNILLIEESLDLSIIQDTSLCSLKLNLNPQQHRKRAIRFADEEGKAMETVHLVEKKEDDMSHHGYQRILVLLLLPIEKKFEFLHAEYSLEARVSVSVLLKQLPEMATDPVIAQQEYIRLCRAGTHGSRGGGGGGGAELINALALQDYGLEQDEILVAVVKGYTGREMHRMSKTLVENPQILRAVKRRNRYEHTLHQIKNNKEFRRDQTRKEREAAILEEEMRKQQRNALQFEFERSRSSKRKQKAKHQELGIEEIEIPLMLCHHQPSDLPEEPSRSRPTKHSSKRSNHSDSKQQSAPEPSAPALPDEDREDEDSVRPICRADDDHADQNRDFGDFEQHEDQRTATTSKQKKSSRLRFPKRNSTKRSTEEKSTKASMEPTNKLGKFAKRRWEQLRSIGARKKAAAAAAAGKPQM